MESRKMVLINLFPSMNRGADMESGFVNTGWEGVCGMNWEGGTDIYTLSCVKQITIGKLLYRTGSSTWCSVMT